MHERVFQVNGYQLAAKEWNRGASYPVLAVHGWLDNAASFDVLAPLLSDCHIICLDLSGHGLSDHKSLQATYNIWDDLLDMLAVADAMDWQRFHLLGHSRGVMMCLLLGAAMPERISSMVLLDAVWPKPVDAKDSPQQLAKFLQDSRAIPNKIMPAYTSVDEAITARCRSVRMSEASARPIVERGLVEGEGQFSWRSDPRLRIASAFKMTQGHIDALTAALTVPGLLILAEQGMGAMPELHETLPSYASLQHSMMAGSHHFHMEEPAEAIATLARENFSQYT